MARPQAIAAMLFLSPLVWTLAPASSTVAPEATGRVAFSEDGMLVLQLVEWGDTRETNGEHHSGCNQETAPQVVACVTHDHYHALHRIQGTIESAATPGHASIAIVDSGTLATLRRLDCVFTQSGIFTCSETLYTQVPSAPWMAICTVEGRALWSCDSW